METQFKKTQNLYKLLGITALLLLVAVYFLPIWWVALQSHQYPKSMYPKGIRIEFKYNGVYNGCKGVKEREEITTNEGAECLVEMNAINHYIGMYPIVQGANTRAKASSNEVPEYYVFNTKKDANGTEIIDPNTQKPIEVDVTPQYLKTLDAILKNSHYIFGVFILMLAFFIFTPKRKNGLFALIPAFTPFYFLILFAYSMYWYGHHLGLHGGGAFSGIKPFMPTIFGHGKVAQFETVSYPYYGFVIDVLSMILILLSLSLKGKYLKLKNQNLS
jgi:hypothetical protein